MKSQDKGDGAASNSPAEPIWSPSDPSPGETTLLEAPIQNGADHTSGMKKKRKNPESGYSLAPAYSFAPEQVQSAVVKPTVRPGLMKQIWDLLIGMQGTTAVLQRYLLYAS